MARSYKVAEVALRVGDLNAAAAFYEDVLGFARHHEMPGIVFLEIGSLDSALGDVGHPQLLALFDRGYRPDQAVTSFDHIAFEVPRDDYESDLARFKDRGMVIRERAWPDSLPWNGKSFFFRDPDDNVVEIIAANEGAEALDMAPS